MPKVKDIGYTFIVPDKERISFMEKIDQSVHGNDYWQCWYDSENGSYELTYNVEHDGDKDATCTYRLIKK